MRSPHPRFWTPEQDALMRELYPTMSADELVARIGRPIHAIYNRAQLLGLKKTRAWIAARARERVLQPGHGARRSQFPKGHRPANKGTRRPGYAPGRMKETQFKKGSRQGRANYIYQPIGAERVSKDGYLERKINDDRPFNRRWRAVHLLVWEAANGPLPRGHAVVFRNGDKTDRRLENLECITRAELMARNTIHTLPKPLVENIYLLTAIKRRVNRRVREEQDRRLA